MIAQVRQREPRSVGDAVDVPFVDAQRDPQVGEVGRILGGVVCRRVEALVPYATYADLVGRDLGLGRLCRQEWDADRIVVGLFSFGALEQRIGEVGAALVDEDHLALGVESRGHLACDLERTRTARPSGEHHERVGLGVV